MKRLFALLLLAFILFLIVFHQRVFVWDPIARVTHDGTRQSGMRVSINYTNDILLDTTSTGGPVYLVQHWDSTPKVSLGTLRCVRFLACMTEADHAPGDPVHPLAPASMSSREVRFTGSDGKVIDVQLW